MITSDVTIISKVNGRIAWLILLFAFINFPLIGQGNLPPADTVNGSQLRDSLERSANPDTAANGAVQGSPDLASPGVSSRGNKIRMAQEDSTKKVSYPDTLDHSPKKAMYFSLALPGLGQAYNKKYFKIPIVYAALGGVGYWIYYNNKMYRSSLDGFASGELDERYVKYYRRQLELSFITLVGVYALQVVDAYVDAHLFYWEVDPDLSLRVQPSFEPTMFPEGMPPTNYGFKFKLTF